MKFSTLSKVEPQLAPFKVQVVQPLVFGVSDTPSSMSQFESSPGVLLLPQVCDRLSQCPTSWVKDRERAAAPVPMDPT